MGAMQLRLLPTPAIDMTDLTVAEDPAFGYEPSLHASEVVASLRLRSLWRGRLDSVMASCGPAVACSTRPSGAQK